MNEKPGKPTPPGAVSDRGVRVKSERLAGRRIGLGVCGGIAAVEVVKVARELRRHGADVTAFFTPSVKDFITALPVEWATGKPVIERIGADADHLETFDLFIVAPATLNTIAKCALGIADNAVTLTVAAQLGARGPLIFVPTMNSRLAEHPAYTGHVRQLESWGATFLGAAAEEDRLKMPAPERVADAAMEVLS